MSAQLDDEASIWFLLLVVSQRLSGIEECTPFCTDLKISSEM
jgi:hypothetical protein